jgi:hypothetical protein
LLGLGLKHAFLTASKQVTLPCGNFISSRQVRLNKEIAMNTAEKNTIKEAILMMMKDLFVMRQGELIHQIEQHMTASEQDLHFFEVREAVAEMVNDGSLKQFELGDGTSSVTVKMLALPQMKVIG